MIYKKLISARYYAVYIKCLEVVFQLYLLSRLKPILEGISTISKYKNTKKKKNILRNNLSK